VGMSSAVLLPAGEDNPTGRRGRSKSMRRVTKGGKEEKI
jgi:hypothetical protein